MKPRRVVISGLGPISGLGVGIEPTWQALHNRLCVIGPIEAFDATGFASHIGSEVRDFKANKVVPKSYRKAVKVMARDIELAVGAADAAARDAALITKGTRDTAAAEGELSYPPERIGAHIGAGLIACEVDELTAALVEALNDDGSFSLEKWGNHGITHLTPLWLLKYLPNMLACHVTIIHDAQGPSNTITCNEASAGLSVGESMRVIQRGAADACFCGGTESKINPMAFLRQTFTGRLNTQDNHRPEKAVRPFCQTAAGSVLGEGGAIVILEALDTLTARGGRAHAELLGFGASQTVNREKRNLEPDPQGRGIELAIRAALRDAQLEPAEIDLIMPFAPGVASYDQPEAAAIARVFGDHLPNIILSNAKPLIGSCGAGASGIDLCLAACALSTGQPPPPLEYDTPLPAIANAGQNPPTELRHALTITTSLGGQNAAIVLGRMNP